jgi:hypothetical protein
MTQIKAISVLQCRQCMFDRHGAEGVERIKQAMTEPARSQVYSDTLLASDWLEVAYAVEHATKYDQTFGDGSGALMMQMIRDVTTQHATGIYRSVFADLTPLAVLEKSSRLWSRYYSQGSSETELLGEKRMVKRVLGCPDFPRNHDWFFIAYYEALLQLAGATEVSVRHPMCVAAGADHCETVIRWK